MERPSAGAMKKASKKKSGTSGKNKKYGPDDARATNPRTTRSGANPIGNLRRGLPNGRRA
jgi:hypothetical protein